MVDSTGQLDFIDEVVGASRPAIRVCIDPDASLELAGGRLHLGPYRSPVHTPRQAAALARAIQNRATLVLAAPGPDLLDDPCWSRVRTLVRTRRPVLQSRITV